MLITQTLAATLTTTDTARQWQLIAVGITALIVGGGAALVASSIIKKRTRKSAVLNSKLSKNLTDEKAKSAIIINSIEDGVVLFDDDKNIQLFNPGASIISGWAIEDVVGLNFHNVMQLVNAKGEPIEDGQNPFERIFLDKKTTRNNEAFLQTKSKQSMPITCSVSPLFGDDGMVTGGVAVFRDVTSERAEEQQRAEFISTASHEMRTPVAAIEGYLALALNDKVATIDARAKGYLDKAHLSTQHLGKLFQDLLQSAKAEDGRLTNHPSVVEMGAFAEQLAGDLKFSAEKKQLFSEFVLGSSNNIDATSEKTVRPLYYVYADPDRLREVVTNIFDNACKYTEQGKVSLGLTGNNDVVQIYVRDTGPGIPAEDLGHLFEKFYRVDNSATRTIGGTGLGLFICRKIVELYHGRIWADSEVGKGSTFFINLPRISAGKAQELQQADANGSTLPTVTSLTNG